MLNRILLAGAALAVMTAGAQAQIQTPGWFGSIQGWYIVDSGNDKIVSLPSGVGAAPDDGWGGKAYMGYQFGSSPIDIAVGLQGGWLSKDTGKGAGSRRTTVKGDYWAVDGEIGYSMRYSETAVRLHIGGRYAEFDHRRSFTGFGPCGSCVNTQDWHGFGPRAGFDVAFGLGGGFSMFGDAAITYLFANNKSRYNPGALSASPNRDSLSGEGQIGVAYAIAPLVNLAVGYRAEYWDDVAHHNGSLNNAGPGNGVDRFMHGPFVRLSYNIGAPVGAPAPVAAPAPVMAKSFIVFFDFDRSVLTPTALGTIKQAADAAKAGKSARVNVTGHADKSGGDQYNMALSLRRANAVKDELVRQGVPAASIVVVGRGESQPLVPTADGVKEPQNRRVEIVLN